MFQGVATLIAASIAAGVSLLNLIWTIWSQRSAEVRAARRQVIVVDLKLLGKALHETLALSNIQLKCIAEPIHKEKYKRAAEAARSLKDLRHEVRYSLWGLDEGLRVLTRLPDWIGHAKGSPETAEELFRRASRLGDALDEAIRKAYVFGAEPSFWQRLRVNREAAALREYYQSYSHGRGDVAEDLGEAVSGPAAGP